MEMLEAMVARTVDMLRFRVCDGFPRALNRRVYRLFHFRISVEYCQIYCFLTFFTYNAYCLLKKWKRLLSFLKKY